VLWVSVALTEAACFGRLRPHAADAAACRTHSCSVGVRGLPVPARGDRVALRWYLRFGLSYRDVEELLAERGIEVDHVTVHRWVRRFAPDAARFGRHRVGDHWHVDETYVKVAGRWSTCTAL
jgi:transposase, IS6 family